MEVREGDYLRNSEFGELVQHVESAMSEYTDAEFKTICDAVWSGQAHDTKHPKLFEEAASFAEKAAGLTLSYAIVASLAFRSKRQGNRYTTDCSSKEISIPTLSARPRAPSR